MKNAFKNREMIFLALGIFLVGWAIFGLKARNGRSLEITQIAPPAKMSVVSTRGSPVVHRGVDKNEEAAVPREITGCFTQNYQHRPTAGHVDRESCAQHDNVVSLDPTIKALCVRVDGVPVSFDRKKDKILIGPLAGPDSVVSVSYCLGQSRCLAPCQIPKDGFMNAIGAGEDSEPAAPALLVSWDPGDSGPAKDVTADMDVDDPVPSQPVQSQLSRFSDWFESAKRPGCTTTLVSVR